MAGQSMNTGKGINKLGVKPGFVKGGYTNGKSANGSSAKGGGSKDGGVSLDGTSGSKGFPTSFGAADKTRAKGAPHSTGQRGSAKGMM